MKASYQLLLAPLILILLAASAFVQKARPPELHESQLTDNNPGSLCSAEASLATAEHNFRGALEAFQLAIDISTRNYGPRLITLGASYALRAQILDYIGDHTRAISDYQHALSLLEEAPGRDTPAYLTVQLAYGRSLRKCGSNQEASHLEQSSQDFSGKRSHPTVR
jgi:tetratricopeptide (TPR) repeat protein